MAAAMEETALPSDRSRNAERDDGVDVHAERDIGDDGHEERDTGNDDHEERDTGNDDHEDNRNATRAALDELIGEDARLKENIETAHESKRKWTSRNSAIERRNSKLELEVKMLQNEIHNLQNEIVAKSAESEKSHDDLETCKSRNKQEAAEFWASFQEEAQKYSNLFTNGLIEYSSNCLKQDIEGYRRQSETVRGLIENIEKETKALINKYGLAELGTNEQADLLADIDIAKKAISDNALLVSTTKAFEDHIGVLKLKVKQKKDDIAYLQKNKLCKK